MDHKLKSNEILGAFSLFAETFHFHDEVLNKL